MQNKVFSFLFRGMRNSILSLAPLRPILLAATALATAQLSAAQSLAGLPELVEHYKHFHQSPELSRQEAQTSAYLASELRKLGYSVTERVGRYEDGAQAYGVVAVLQNGAGPKLLIRSDMDALPVEEKTGLAFASTVKAPSAQGQPTGVMHACGHDLHMTVLIGTAREMAAHKSQWHGTLILVGQPSEEIAQGAAAMLRDNLYQRFGRPDFILAEHDDPKVEAGSIALKPGPAFAASNTINVLLRGIGGHGSQPQAGKDPILLSAEFILLAQTIVSRQIDPRQPAVLSVGSIHGGSKSNIIPDEVALAMTLRTYSAEVRDQILAAVRRTADGIAQSYGIPADRMPLVTLGESTEATRNDPALSERMHKAAVAALGADKVQEADSEMASEDVGLFSLQNKIPSLLYRLGTANPAKLAESRKTGVPLPILHSAQFAPDYEPAIATGVRSMTAMALDLLQ